MHQTVCVHIDMNLMLYLARRCDRERSECQVRDRRKSLHDGRLLQWDESGSRQTVLVRPRD